MLSVCCVIHCAFCSSHAKTEPNTFFPHPRWPLPRSLNNWWSSLLTWESIYLSLNLYTLSAVCVCMRVRVRDEVNLWPVFAWAPCLEKIQRGLRVVWPVQMVYELMRSMWRSRCSLDTWWEYWVFSVFFFSPSSLLLSLSLWALLITSTPALAQRKKL